MRDRRAHVKISRRFFEEDEFWNEPRRFSRAEAWVDLIQLASWRPRQYAVGLTVETLGRGEFMASLRFLGQRWRWGKSAVERFMKTLQKAGRLAGQREGQDGTVYLLVNYNYYQGADPAGGTHEGTAIGTAAGQQRDKTEALKQVKHTKTTWLTPFADAWQARCGNPPFGRLAKSLAPLVQQLGEPEALQRWSRYLAATEPKFCSPSRFAETHAAYASPTTLELTDDFGRPRLHSQRDGWWGYTDETGTWVRTVEIGKVPA